MEGTPEENPDLIHGNSSDAEFDNLTYDYEIYEDEAMTIPVTSYENRPQQSGESTSWKVDVNLADDQVYFWRVRASDGFEDGAWSDLAQFWANPSNDPPAAFTLLSPDDGIVLSDGHGLFVWQATDGGDLIDEIIYRLQFSSNPDFTSFSSIEMNGDTSYQTTTPFPFGASYYWRVRADDQFSGITYSDVRAFATGMLGDANNDQNINIGDILYIINYIFKSGPPPEPLIMGDADCDGEVLIGDGIYLINFVFKSGPPPGCD